MANNVIASHFLPYYTPSNYRGISLANLLPASELGGLEPERSLLDFCSQLYTWEELVSRHLSRQHWLAVKSEQERMLTEWTHFITFVNTHAERSFKQKAVEYWMARLLPKYPPAPKLGQFMYQECAKNNIRKALLESTESFFNTLCVEMWRKRPEEYRICDMNASWNMHKQINCVNPLVRRLIEEPEKARRKINACRNFSMFKLPPVPIPGLLTPETHHQEFEPCVWAPLPEEIEACQVFLHEGITLSTLWVRCTHETTIGNRKAFICSEHVLDYCLEGILLTTPFEKVCQLIVRWVNEEENILGMDTTENAFTILVESTAISFSDILDKTQEMINKECVAESVMIVPHPPKIGDFSRGVTIITAKDVY